MSYAILLAADLAVGVISSSQKVRIRGFSDRLAGVRERRRRGLREGRHAVLDSRADHALRVFPGEKKRVPDLDVQVPPDATPGDCTASIEYLVQADAIRRRIDWVRLYDVG
jgi:hypothetical protein